MLWGQIEEKRLRKWKIVRLFGSDTELHTHGSFVQQSRGAEDVLLTDIGHWAFYDALAVLQTSVALERIPRSLTVGPEEHFQLSDTGHQHQLERERRVRSYWKPK